MTFRRCSIFLLMGMLSLGCVAQSGLSAVQVRIERQIRSYYSVPPEVKISIGSPMPSEFANYNNVTITFNSTQKQRSYEFLLSKDGKVLIRMTRLELTKDPYLELMKKIDLAGRPTRGNRHAKVVAVSYDDFECPFCSRLHQTLFPELLKEYGDRVQFIYKDFPLPQHPWAMHAAVDANCLAAQNSDAYWGLADYLHANQEKVSSKKDRDSQLAELDRLTLDQGAKRNLDARKLASCVKEQHEDAVRASVKEGQELGVEDTPTLFINGEKIDGAQPIGDLRAAFDRALEQARVLNPSN